MAFKKNFKQEIIFLLFMFPVGYTIEQGWATQSY